MKVLIGNSHHKLSCTLAQKSGGTHEVLVHAKSLRLRLLLLAAGFARPPSSASAASMSAPLMWQIPCQSPRSHTSDSGSNVNAITRQKVSTKSSNATAERAVAIFESPFDASNEEGCLGET